MSCDAEREICGVDVLRVGIRCGLLGGAASADAMVCV